MHIKCMSTHVKHISNDASIPIYPDLSVSIRIYPGPPNVPRANHSFLDSALVATNPPKKCQIGTVFGTVLRADLAHRQHKQRISLHANTVSHDHGWSALTLHVYIFTYADKQTYDILPCESYLFISVMSSVMLLGLSRSFISFMSFIHCSYCSYCLCLEGFLLTLQSSCSVCNSLKTFSEFQIMDVPEKLEKIPAWTAWAAWTAWTMANLYQTLHKMHIAMHIQCNLDIFQVQHSAT